MLAASVLVAVSVGLSAPHWGWWADFTPDGFYYLNIARTLWESGCFPQERIMASPGFPLLMAPLFAWGEAPLLPLRILLTVGWALAGGATYLLHRQELGERPGWLAGLVVATSPMWLMLAKSPLSESAYVAALSLTLVFLRRWWRRGVSHAGEACVGGILTASVVLVRSMGIVILPLMVLPFFRHRGRCFGRWGICFLTFAICAAGPLAGWHMRQRAYPDGPSYARYWTTPRDSEPASATVLALQWDRLQQYGPKRLEAIKTATTPQILGWRLFQPPVAPSASWLIGGFFVALSLLHLSIRRDPIDVFVLGTLGMLAFWPFDEGVRFVAPLLPVLAAYPIWLGCELWRRGRRGGLFRAAIVCALLAGIGAQAAELGLLLRRMPNEKKKTVARMDEMQAVADWLKDSVKEGESWIGVTPNGDPSKIVLIGGAYFARRPLTAVDVASDETWISDASRHVTVIAQGSIVERLPDRWEFQAIRGNSRFFVRFKSDND